MKKMLFPLALLILSLCLPNLVGAPNPLALVDQPHLDKVSPWVLDATADGAQMTLWSS